MKRFILICILSILFSTLFSDDNIDSLQIKLISSKGIDRADILREIGVIHHYNANLKEALEYYQRALEIYKELDNKEGIAQSLINIGVICENWEDFAEALEYYQRSLEINKELDNKKGIARSLISIGNLSCDAEALEYFQRSLEISKELDNKELIALSLNNIGSICENWEDFAEALEYYQRSLEIYKELDDKFDIAFSLKNIGNIYNQTNDQMLAKEYLERSIKIAEELESTPLLCWNYESLSETYSGLDMYKKALEYYKLYSAIKDSISSEEQRREFTNFKIQAAVEIKEKENEILIKNNTIQELQIKKRNMIILFTIIGFILVLILVIIVYNRYLLKKKANEIISEEKAKSDKLLLNILPVRIVNDLKETGVTEPEVFENVTVYFSDIVGFTKLSSHLEPKFLIDELNDIFTAFDNIIGKNQCERIKTIGDAYLAVCGLPVANELNAINIINSAIETIDYLKKRNIKSEIEWKIRIGIHSGKVIGGVVGIKKYIYDVFGDTINTAARMETNSEPMQINVSETTYKLTKNDFKYIEREPIRLKGKGVQKMYFIQLNDREIAANKQLRDLSAAVVRHQMQQYLFINRRSE
jgi:class 3 adenylate cyclase/Tfp pilus assembly protein PilF